MPSRLLSHAVGEGWWLSNTCIIDDNADFLMLFLDGVCKASDGSWVGNVQLLKKDILGPCI